MDIRLDVDLSLLPSEAAEVVPEYPSRHRRHAGTEPVDLRRYLNDAELEAFYAAAA